MTLEEQMAKRVTTKPETSKKLDGDTSIMISTGSTLLDLAISGGRIRGGGLPIGILVEIFGPSGSGKTVLLCEIAGEIQRKKGEIIFHDPEARLNKQFAEMFGLDSKKITYSSPNTIPEVFQVVRTIESKKGVIYGVMTDSLTALSTDTEMGSEEGDKMGTRRAKEFSQELRRTARIITENNILMVCSNQVRQNIDAGPYGQKYSSPGGEAIGFYSSLRLRTFNPKKIYKEISYKGKKVKEVIGVTTDIEVFKSSVWKPYGKVPVTIIFDYGVDDIRENLQYIKDFNGKTVYSVGDMDLDKSMEKSIVMVEEKQLEDTLKNQVIDLWEEIESKFKSNRKLKQR